MIACPRHLDQFAMAQQKKTVASQEVSGRQILQLAKKFRLKIQNCLSINLDCRTNNTTLNPSLFPYCLREKWPINPLWVHNHFSQNFQKCYDCFQRKKYAKWMDVSACAWPKTARLHDMTSIKKLIHKTRQNVLIYVSDSLYNQ